MKYERFEDLPVWKAAIELAVQIFALTENETFRGKGDLRNQLERAAVSVSNNIAEGFERGTTPELLTFLYIARGSVGEVRSMLHLLDRLPPFSNLKSQISNLRTLAENISRQLRGWADSLQNSEVKGQRYLNDKTRQSDQRKNDRQEVLIELRQAHEDILAREQTRIQAQQKKPDESNF
ncbi:MAG: four helix bundle protein [Acidobacteriota bacterium]|nr:four helix bundle protein [Acidobacteriota bacterium]